MNWLVRLYPKAWREQYHDEFLALLEQHHLLLLDILNIALAAARVRLTIRRDSRNAVGPTRTLAKFIAVVSCLLLVLGASFSLNGPTVQASPRYPVYFGVSNSMNRATYSITNLGASIPQLTLVVDSKSAWTLGGYETLRADQTGPYQGASVFMHHMGRNVYEWSFGRVSTGQSVQLTVSFASNAANPSPYAMAQHRLHYSIVGYGNLRTNGKSDPASQLTGKPYGFGALTYTPLPPPAASPSCGTALHFTLTAYQVCTSGGSDARAIWLNALNAGKRIPHFVLVVNSRKLWTAPAATATQWNGKNHVDAVAHLLSHRGSVYTWDFGALPPSVVLRVHISIVTTGGLGDSMTAYADLAPGGQPDKHSKLFSGGDTFR